MLSPVIFEAQDLQDFDIGGPVATSVYSIYFKAPDDLGSSSSYLWTWSRSLWISYIEVLTLCTLLLYTMTNLRKWVGLDLKTRDDHLIPKRANSEVKLLSLGNCFLVILGAATQQDVQIRTKVCSLRVLLVVLLIFNSLMMTSYTSVLVSRLTVGNTHSYFTSLEDIPDMESVYLSMRTNSAVISMFQVLFLSVTSHCRQLSFLLHQYCSSQSPHTVGNSHSYFTSLEDIPDMESVYLSMRTNSAVISMFQVLFLSVTSHCRYCSSQSPHTVGNSHSYFTSLEDIPDMESVYLSMRTISTVISMFQVLFLSVTSHCRYCSSQSPHTVGNSHSYFTSLEDIPDMESVYLSMRTNSAVISMFQVLFLSVTSHCRYCSSQSPHTVGNSHSYFTSLEDIPDMESVYLSMRTNSAVISMFQVNDSSKELLPRWNNVINKGPCHPDPRSTEDMASNICKDQCLIFESDNIMSRLLVAGRDCVMLRIRPKKVFSQISIMFKKHFAYSKILRQQILKMKNTGILDLLEKRFLFEKDISPGPQKYQEVTIGHVKALVVVYAAALLISCILLFVEKAIGKKMVLVAGWKNHRKP
ncbi:uncharacterized protein LOC128997430 [Macrosteles quadrilineatus]|uniref:uncharacterized protein LOC128997430 n=1 Tax=Macrosteles quadrilineatus TaxID=74068 RepID=UPI0023E09B7D|nr:uncharacterized protein LOC128997430 [Macrosteles quadrilineatus]